MLCFVISKREYDLCLEGLLNKEPDCVCIGSIGDIEEAKDIANLLPCITDIKIEGKINKCCYIVCNV